MEFGVVGRKSAWVSIIGGVDERGAEGVKLGVELDVSDPAVAPVDEIALEEAEPSGLLSQFEVSGPSTKYSRPSTIPRWAGCKYSAPPPIAGIICVKVFGSSG